MDFVTNLPLSARAVARRLLALFAAVGLLAGGLAFASAPVTAAGVPVLAVTKSLPVPGPFLRQQNFVYSMAYSCSSLETACPNATLVDTLPSNLEFVSATSTSSPSTFSQVGQVLTWTFTSDLGDSSIGLVAGTYSTIYIATPVMLLWHKGDKSANTRV